MRAACATSSSRRRTRTSSTDLDAANIGYKLVRELAGASAYGALLQGFTHRVAKLSRGSTPAEIAGTAQLLRELAG
ncbi:MAG TPA: phosphate acyltransferase [Kofleriaceae bacterium]|nr:phosphate acyltransferase [Kofleriaceae bacterium]